jgi:protein-S-isoprenylcysteine O-methyltransferase Ste14
MRRADALWLAGQGVLFVLAFIVVPRTDGWFGRVDLPAARPLGWAVFVAGGVIAICAMLQLGRQLVPQPSPVRDGRLIDTGLYGVVRHPIYSGVLLLIAGSVLRVPSLAGLLVVVASAVFFDRKSAYEEALLARAYAEYDTYRRRVRAKLVPGIR